MAIIEVEHVTKEYRLGALHGIRQTLGKLRRRLSGELAQPQPRFKALDDVSFSVEEGEVVGLIGHNGAGKSTLLKLLSRITVPTTGRVRVHGRVAPLIEVGAGLVPDLTGRENVYLNGAILGMGRAEVARKFDDIVGFAELEQFIDTPVKRYSSGMQVRLGFAIATSVDAEILIVDEVLAVGDLAFQRKCFDRMEKLISDRSRTVLVVGHNIRQLERICTRMVLLDHGKIICDAEPSLTTDEYYRLANRKVKTQRAIDVGHLSGRDDSGEVIVRSVTALEGGASATVVDLHGSLSFRVEFEVTQFLDKPEIVVGFHTSDFVYIASASTARIDSRPSYSPGAHRITFRARDIPMRPGEYFLRLAFIDKFRRMMWYAEGLVGFQVTAPKGVEAKLPEVGLIDLPFEWDFQNQFQFIETSSL